MKNYVRYAALYFLVTLFVPKMLNVFFPDMNMLFVNIYNIISFILLAILAISLFKNDLINDLKELKKHPIKVLLLAIVTFFLTTIIGVIITLAFNIQNITQNQEAVNNFISSSIFSTFIVVILGPFVEEIVFRHFLIGKLSKKYPLWLLCIFSSIIFGLIHIDTYTLSGILEIRQYIIIGASMSLIYVFNKKNLSYPLIAHIFNNLVASLIFLLA